MAKTAARPEAQTPSSVPPQKEPIQPQDNIQTGLPAGSSVQDPPKKVPATLESLNEKVDAALDAVKELVKNIGQLNKEISLSRKAGKF